MTLSISLYGSFRLNTLNFHGLATDFQIVFHLTCDECLQGRFLTFLSLTICLEFLNSIVIVPHFSISIMLAIFKGYSHSYLSASVADEGYSDNRS